MQKHTFYQILSSITACLVMLHIGTWPGYLSVVLVKFRAGELPISMTSDNISWMIALADLGTFLSPFPAGYLMDRFGRLFVLRLAFIFYLLATPLILGATTPYDMYLALLLVGLSAGIGHSTLALYVAEIAKPKIRGSLGSIGGVLYSGGMAATITFGPYLSFRSLTWTTLVCPLVGFTLSFFVIESPYYFFIQNNEISANNTLSRIRNKTKTSEKNVELESIRKRVDDDLKNPGNFLELISQRSNRRALTIVLVLGVVRAACGFGCIIVFAPAILPANSLWDPNISMMLFSWLNVIFSFLGLSLVDRFGRKPLLIFSSLGLFSVTTMMAIFCYFHQRTNVDVAQFAFVPHVAVLLSGAFFPIGVSLMSQIYRGELFSVKIKGPASAIATMVMSVVFFIVNKVYLTVEQNIGAYVMYVVFSTVNFISIIFTVTCVFETKGKTLEEIQNILNR